MTPEVNIIFGKVSVASLNRAGGSGGGSDSLSGDFEGKNLLRKILGSKELLN